MKRLMEPFRVMLRPFYRFGELKLERRFSPAAAWLMAVLALAAYFARMIYAGPGFTTFNPRSFNLLREAASVCLPFLLLVVCNWAVAAIMDGEGTMREIFCVMCYAMAPYVLMTLLGLGFTHILVADEVYLITFVDTLGAVWTGFLMFAGLLTVHQYTPKKTVGTLLLTVVMMVLAIFALILFASVADKMISYIGGIVNEIKLRV
ncbi:MAG: Yip1 family protein [Aristaeellaceae bacterium]